MIRADLSDIPAYKPGKLAPRALKLSSNEMAHQPLPSVQEAIAGASAGINRYPDMAAVQLRTALAGYLGVTAEQVAVGCGSTALCQQLIEATCHDGDEVVFAWRSFEAYPILVRVAGATPVAVPLTDDHRHDLDAMAAAITDRTRLVFVCNPNNPTGTTISAAEFDAFLEQVPDNVVVVLDEAYIEFTDDFDAADPTAATEATPNALQVIAEHANVVGMRTFSKVWGLAGLRVGYLFGAEELIDAVNRCYLPFSVNTVAQVAAIACLEPAARAELLGRTREVNAQRERVTGAVNSAADDEAVVPDSQGNFVWIPEDKVAAVAGIADAEGVTTGTGLASVLTERGVVTRCFPGEGLRITVTTAAETERLLAALHLS
ncbi:histidinol-phosphate transaminase [Corynebacterium sp. TAE3-ERU12]|uniref:histidinol-phosphate transaminase n=1 Tax=Corynebacterium sp. TAE3-ERU12 TaxID=2849491 RepID=UPI001C43F3C1|nr:histidinol-phosphate transaminase [Corynebacterium sp. TAE3-ERU12]MBV7294423.1 histidinol-phosphate transaminase [Corynebacterium sp. TAE3-ERU12]